MGLPDGQRIDNAPRGIRTKWPLKRHTPLYPMNLVSMGSIVNHGWETILCFGNLDSAFLSRWNCCRLFVVACLLLLLSKTFVCITKIFFHRWWLFPFIFLLKMWWLIEVNSDWLKVEDLSPHWPVSFYFADRVDLSHSISFVFFRMRKYYLQLPMKYSNISLNIREQF